MRSHYMKVFFYLGAGVPRGASATSAPGAVAAPKLGAGLEFKKKKLNIFRRPKFLVRFTLRRGETQGTILWSSG